MKALKRLTRPILVLLALLPLSLPSCAKKASVEPVSDPIAAGWNEYFLGEWDRAIAVFEAAANASPPGGDLRLKALYGLATTWNLRRPGENLEKARELYRQVIAEGPKSDMAAWCLLGLARMEHLVPVGQDPDYDKVLATYQSVMDEFPDHLAAKEAFIYYHSVLVSSLDEAQTRKALKALREYVSNPSEEFFIGPAWSLIAVSCTTLGDPEGRLEAEIRSLETTEVDPTNPFTEFSWQYWNIATIAEFEVGDFETARTYYRKLIAEYPQDIKIYGARQALERMGRLEEKLRGGS